MDCTDVRHSPTTLASPAPFEPPSKLRLPTARAFLAFLGLATVVGTSGCASIRSLRNTIDNGLQNAVASMDRAIAALASQSSDWQLVVQNLEKEVAADVQSTIRNEITTLAGNAVGSTGVEVRCNAEYMRRGLARELIRLRNTIAEDLNQGLSAKIRLLEAPEETPYICAAVPSAIDLNIDPERRLKVDIYGFSLRAKPITVSVLTAGLFKPKLPAFPFQSFLKELKTAKLTRSEKALDAPSFRIENPASRLQRDIGNALSVTSDFHAVLDLTASGFEILPNSLSLVFSWDGRIQSELAVLTHQKVTSCSIDTRPWNPGGTEKVTFVPPPVTENLYGKSPDKDFHGHGPCVSFRLTLSLDAARKNLAANYFMDAWECKDGDFTTIHSDYTEAVGSGSTVLFTAGDNEKILGYDVASNLTHAYFDTTVGVDDHFSFAGTAPVSELVYVGDTNGDEAGSRTRVTMVFRPFAIKLETCTNE